MDQITSSFLASPLAVDLPARMQLSADTLAFTHTSKHKAKHQQFEAEDDEDQDYERLEVRLRRGVVGAGLMEYWRSTWATQF